MPPVNIMMDTNFFIEFAYASIVIVSSLVIFLKTRELFKLSSHQGIRYFSMSFLFFAITYLLRFFSRILFLGLMVTGTRIPRQSFMSMTSMLFIYAGYMTIFYLLYGLSQKKMKKWLPSTTDVFHVFSIIISAIIVMLNMSGLFILTNVLLLAYMSHLVYMDYKVTKKEVKEGKKEKKGKGLPGFGIVYLLLIMFLALNIIDIIVPNFLRTAQTLIYLLSISLFLLILYRVMRILDVEPTGKDKREKKQA